MLSIFKKKPEEKLEKKEEKPTPPSQPSQPKSDTPQKLDLEGHIICTGCFQDFSVRDIHEAGGECPSCHTKIDLTKARRGHI